MGERVRTTISLDSDVLAIFEAMGAATNMSTSRAMGDWLSDTSEAAEMILLQLQAANLVPLNIIRDMKLVIAGMSTNDENSHLKPKKARSTAAGLAHARAVRPPTSAPSSNTGLKSPLKAKSAGTKL